MGARTFNIQNVDSGVYIKRKEVSGTATFTIRAPNITSSGVRQIFFLIGMANGEQPIAAIIGIRGVYDSAVVINLNSQRTISAAYSTDTTTLTITLPSQAWDNFLIISPTVFYV